MGSGTRRLSRGRALAAAALFAITGIAAIASADFGASPSWELAKDYFDPGGSSAMLTPGNDTRVNLVLLLADRHGTPVRDAAAAQEGPPLLFFPWAVMAAAAEPRADADATAAWEPSRCQSNPAGAAAFVAAVRASDALSEAEKQLLVEARLGFAPTCGGEGLRPARVAVSSRAGRAYAAYLDGAADFYAGEFNAAREVFTRLADERDPWLREAALYMVARTELNRAQAASFGDYGELAETDARDHGAIAAAGAAFQAYLAAYPQGRYASSARGLTRRVAWLGGDMEALSDAFARQLANRDGFDGAPSAVALSEEIDRKLLTSREAPPPAQDALLLAVQDLYRMRCTDDFETDEPDCGPRLSLDELERQAPVFANDRALFDYLRAAHAFFVRHAPDEVLALVPETSGRSAFTYLEFSRQLLRGMALEAKGEAGVRAFWLSLFERATQPYQREALEIALALHEERSGAVERVFAADSKIRHPVIRQLMIEYVAGPDLLRRRAEAPDAPDQERAVATFVLLAKELRHGLYRDFLADVRLVPAGASNSGYHLGARYYDPAYDRILEPPPLGRFGSRANVGTTGCPALVATVRRLAASRNAVGPRLCLAEFFRSNGFDEFELDSPLADRGLASSRSPFPGPLYSRLEVYKSIIDDPAATADQRALALNRAIRCYGPSGNNSCGGTEVGLDQRRAWFVRLKRDFETSEWSRSLQYYW